MKVSVGDSIPRIDGADKAAGRTRYIADLDKDGVWFGAVVRSPAARGRLKAVHWDESMDWSGIVRVEASDVPGENIVSIIQKDMPCLAQDKVMYLGEPVALVAAKDPELARRAANAARVEVEQEPPVVTLDEAVNAYRQDPETAGVLHSIDMAGQDLDELFSRCEVVVEAEYRTGPQEHVYLEPQAVVAHAAGGMVKILGSMQCPYYVRPAVAAVMGLEHEKVIVEQAPMGGAFGGKEDFPSLLASHAALLSMRCGEPVMMTFGREEDISFTTKRHPSLIRLKSGVMKDGTFVALDVELYLDGGAYVTLSPVVLSRAAIHVCGPYRWQSVEVRARALRTNMPPYGAFRGFGAPQAHFAIESHVDDVAATLGIDPVELREKNLMALGDRTATGQVLKESVAASECLAAVKDMSGLAHGSGDTGSTPHNGVGVACFWHGGGFTGSGEEHIAAEVAVDLHPGGEVEIRVSSTEMGQGERTTLSQIASQACGAPFEHISCNLPDTSRVPDSGPTVASRTIMMVGRLVKEACEALGAFVRKKNGIPIGGDIHDWPAAAAAAAGGRTLSFPARYQKPEDLQWDEENHLGDAYAAYAWGAVAAEVDVDPTTLEVTVRHVWCAVDAGKAINPVIARGQIEGGLVQAMGYAMMENMEITRDGRFVQNRLQDYVIPTSMDAPTLHVQLLESPYSGGPYGAKGLGELPMNGLAPALRNALRKALGIAVNELPMTPEVLLRHLHRNGD